MWMLAKYLKQTKFKSYEDFKSNFEISIPDNFNFAYDVIDRWAKHAPNKIAMSWLSEDKELLHFSFADLKNKSDQTAVYFQNLGIEKGDKVMLILKGRYQFWYSILALHKIGAIAVPATHLLSPKDLIFRNNAASIKMVVAVGDKKVIDNISVAQKNSPTLKHMVSIGPIVPENWSSFTSGIIDTKPFVRPKSVNENNDISLIYFTSGTTAEPKMVAHDFIYPLGHIVTASYWHNLHEDSVHLTLADTGWGKAVWGRLYGQWIAGAEVFVYDYAIFSPVDMLKTIAQYNVTSFCAPPTVYRFLIREDLSRFDLSSLKYCTVAGEPLSAEVYDKFLADTGIKLREGFGQTETTLTIGTFAFMEPRSGSMGFANPQYDIHLLNSEGEFCEAGEHGEIVIKIDGEKPVGLFNSYYLNPEGTNSACYDEYYHSGDIAYCDDDGYFYFVGRNDDIIKSSGYRISPFEIESVLMSHDAVIECAVVGVPDNFRGQVVKAFIVLSDEYDAGAKTLMREIQSHVKKSTALYKYPRVVEFVDNLPKTISGKIKRAELRNRNCETI
ncbi:MAG: AMP-binding protein [Desulfotalea sp.]